MKIDLISSDWVHIADAVLNEARRERSSRLLRLAARLNRTLGFAATAATIETEAERMEAAR